MKTITEECKTLDYMKQEMEQKEEMHELALILSKIVHDKCSNVPHDIGLYLADAVDLHRIHKG